MNPYVLYLRLAAAAAIAVALGLVAFQVHRWHQGFLHVASVEAQAKRDRATYTATLQSYKDAQAASAAASTQYQRELHEIRNRPVATGPVRLCLKPASVPRTASGSSGPGPTPTASGVLPSTTGSDLEAGPDIAADLYRLADQADQVAAQARALQSLK
jgi:hypothetical protein